jgi:hypothetical protein
MKTVKVSDVTFDCLIEGLESALNVCYNVDSSSDDVEKSYPYALGYSKAAMQMIVQQLHQIKSQIN